MPRQKEKKEEKPAAKQPVDSEKKKAIDQAVLQIEKHFGKGSIMTLG